MQEIIRLVEQTLYLHKSRKADYDRAAYYANKCFRKVLEGERNSLAGISHRVKAEASLKEKIFRRQYYKYYSSANEILDNTSDALGVLIECRFVSDEGMIYDRLKDSFACVTEDGLYCYHERFPEIQLKLDAAQPQFQRNGNTIYRIDGRYQSEELTVAFELQIKSLMNKFWSDIEHSVVYKNNVYLPNNSYAVNMLALIRNNLLGIDKMLQTVKDQIETMSAPVADNMDIKILLSKLYNDLINRKMFADQGIVTRSGDVSNLLACLSICTLLLQKRGFQDLLTELTFRIEACAGREIDFSQDLSPDFSAISPDDTTAALSRLIDTDYEWHVFYLFFQLILQPYDPDCRILVSVINYYCGGTDDYSMEHISQTVYAKMQLYGEEELALPEGILDAV